jgi:hypothetical protein
LHRNQPLPLHRRVSVPLTPWRATNSPR